MGLNNTETSPILAPVLMADDTISRLNEQGYREHFPPLKIVDEAREAQYKMPQGKTGVVLGSGQNTEIWKKRGWKTVDLDPTANADFTLDANKLDTVIPQESVDYVLAEYITFHPEGTAGVQSKTLLEQSFKILKKNGILIIQTGNQEGVDTRLPDRKQYANEMSSTGFQTVVELHSYSSPTDTWREQQLIYYGKKN